MICYAVTNRCVGNYATYNTNKGSFRSSAATLVASTDHSPPTVASFLYSIITSERYGIRKDNVLMNRVALSHNALRVEPAIQALASVLSLCRALVRAPAALLLQGPGPSPARNVLTCSESRPQASLRQNPCLYINFSLNFAL